MRCIPAQVDHLWHDRTAATGSHCLGFEIASALVEIEAQLAFPQDEFWKKEKEKEKNTRKDLIFYMNPPNIIHKHLR